MRKMLPVGIENFEEFSAENYYYVDKTMFIAELLRNRGKVNLFTRPRRFGKSLNMSMLKCFFEVGCDEALFDGLAISGEKELCEAYMGQFPVISVSLKSVEGRSYEEACAALRSVIGMEALRFQFLAGSNKLSAEEKAVYAQLIEVGTAQGAVYAMSDAAMLASLRNLSLLLTKHYGRKAILLIDEYDVPLDKAFQAGYYDEMVSLVRNLFGNALKTNDSLQFAVLTGCLPVDAPSPPGSKRPRQVDEVGFPAKLEKTSLSSQCQSIFTGLNNLNVMTVSDPYFCSSFGFTDEEVKELLGYYGLEDFYDTVRSWYDGYQFGDVSIYCPWDVIKYVQILLRNREAEPENYWANTSGNDLIRRFIGIADKNTRDEIERLVNGETILKTIKQELTYRDIDDSIDNIWSVLLATGYLTQKGPSSGRQVKLALPNKEIRELFIELVRDWFQETTRADLSRIERFCRAFPAGDASTIEEMLHDYLWDSISVRDTAVRRDMKENFYHGMVLGLLQSQSEWLVRSNVELGEGYSDISVCTPDKVGIVIELKYAADGNLGRSCAEALKQIEDRKYAEGLKRMGMKKIIKYGIAFHEKECKVAIE